MRQHPPYTRRQFLSGIAASTLVLCSPSAFAEALIATPRQTEGPFYPDKLPLDVDNDLIIINDGLAPAVGTITHLSGRVVDARGAPVKNALVEIWQVDNNGVYLHSADTHAKRDANFQGYGRFETAASGEYRFRTIKPVPYPGRTPHIHVKVSRNGTELLTTQCYVKGHPLNARDGVLASLRDAKALESVLVSFEPAGGKRVGELMARFDIVLAGP